MVTPGRTEPARPGPHGVLWCLGGRINQLGVQPLWPFEPGAGSSQSCCSVLELLSLIERVRARAPAPPSPPATPQGTLGWAHACSCLPELTFLSSHTPRVTQGSKSLHSVCCAASERSKFGAEEPGGATSSWRVGAHLSSPIPKWKRLLKIINVVRKQHSREEIRFAWLVSQGVPAVLL